MNRAHHVLSCRHKNHGVDGSPLDSQSARDLEEEEGGSKCGLQKYPIPPSLGTSARKKYLESDIGKGALAGAAQPKRLQLQPLTDFRSQTAPIPDEKDVNGRPTTSAYLS